MLGNSKTYSQNAGYSCISEKMGEVDSKDISVIVQGAIDSINTKSCLSSIRKYLPNAEIILSTWKNSNISNLDFDILLENDDPGYSYYQNPKDYPETKVNNVNRQIVSTINALKYSTKKYSLKIRTDFEICSNDFLKYFDKYNLRDERLSIFKRRIFITSWLTTHSFFPCDWVQFGLTKDLIKLFDIPLMSTADSEYFYYKAFKNKKEKNIFDKCNSQLRYFPEQHIFYSCFKNNYYDIGYKDFLNDTKIIQSISEEILLDNFAILESNIFYIKPLKSSLNQAYNILTDNSIYKKYKNCWINNHIYNDLYEEKYIKHKKPVSNYIKNKIINLYLKEKNYD